MVTLEHEPGSQCWGAAYLIAGTYDEQQKTLAVRAFVWFIDAHFLLRPPYI